MNRPVSTSSSLVMLAGTDLAFPCHAHQPLLEAAYAAGIALPYACRRGICGLCAAELVQGDVVPIDALPMTNAQCGPSQVLLCRCQPAGQPVTLRPTTWKQLPQPRRLPPL